MGNIVVVRHYDGDLNDTACTHLANSNYRIKQWYPFKEPENRTLPDIASTHGTIIMGGTQNVTELDQHSYLQHEIDWILACIAADLPVIGICLGSQLIAHALGGEVTNHSEGICEFGYEPVYPEDTEYFPETQHFTQAHFQGISLPPGATLLASGKNFPCQAFKYKHNVFGFQFHPEVHSTMFEEWMQLDLADAFYATPGARPACMQLKENEKYNARQTKWFMNLLDKVLPPLATHT